MNQYFSAYLAEGQTRRESIKLIILVAVIMAYLIVLGMGITQQRVQGRNEAKQAEQACLHSPNKVACVNRKLNK